MPETLETIAEKIAELGQSINVRFGKVDARFDAVDARFDAVDARFDAVDARVDTVSARFDAVDARVDTVSARFDAVDAQFDQVKSQLRVEIEAVRGDVRLVAEGLAAQTVLLKRIDAGRERLGKRVDKHDLRIRALEPPKPA
ncbi:MAG: hypothetical protein M3541_22735 [Acidobacteriota bacterium]|nr:hypothetical protein [Acidobacteriota bacterium]